MADRPIIMSGESVRAILSGEKTQTRRVINPQPPSTKRSKTPWACVSDMLEKCPYGRVGDRLWVKEGWGEAGMTEREQAEAIELGEGSTLFYRADWPDENVQPSLAGRGWRSPLFMPRWASRLTLEITEIRVQRVQEISDADCVAEGVRIGDSPKGNIGTRLHCAEFARRWDALNAKRGFPWVSNPWCWCLSFKRVEAKS